MTLEVKKISKNTFNVCAEYATKDALKWCVNTYSEFVYTGSVKSDDLGMSEISLQRNFRHASIGMMLSPVCYTMYPVVLGMDKRRLFSEEKDYSFLFYFYFISNTVFFSSF